MSVEQAYEQLSAIEGATVVRDERMVRHTTLRVGGVAALFVTCDTFTALRRTVDALLACGVPWVIMGRGSGVIVADEGFAGAVLCLGEEFRRLRVDDRQTMHAGAAVNVQRAVQDAFSRGLTGLEGLAGVPGTMGGAVSTNATMGDSFIGTIVDEIVSFRPGTGFVRHAGSDVTWFPRVTDLPSSEVILEVAVRLAVGGVEAEKRLMETALSWRGSTQPIRRPSVDAIFADPVGEDGRMIDARGLIESCGMAGHTCGRARAFEANPNYIVNLGGATSSEVVQVIYDIMSKVRQSHGIELRPEVKFLGFPS